MSSPDLKSAIVTLLRKNQQIGMDCVLSCYATHDGLYTVDYLYTEDTVKALHLEEQELASVLEDEELVEYFDTPEEAAEFYLKLTGGNMTVFSHVENGGKRTLKEKMTSHEKDQYFD